MNDLLPLNATASERALSEAIARLSDVPLLVRESWNPDTCPAELLPWLAWASSVDEWDSLWSDAQKRDTIKRSLQVHKYKGTIGAVRDALGALGITAEVQEWFNQIPEGTPHTFTVYLEADQTPVTLTDIAKVLGVINFAKNQRSHIDRIVPRVKSRSTLFVGAASGLGCEITVPPSDDQHAQLIPNFITAEDLLDQITNVDLAGSLGA